MNYKQTLLAKLAPKFGPHQTENIAVEALGHILSESEAARHALSDVLRTGGAEVGNIARVRTQASGAKRTQPDLAGFDQCGAERVLIEAKFGARLTENQPVAYLKRLPENQGSVLLFVAPAARIESLWTDLCRLVTEAKIELVPGPEEATLRWAVAGGERRLMLTSWVSLLDRMAVQAAAAADSHTECDIRQLRGLAEQMDDETLVEGLKGELGPEFSRRVPSQRLIKDAALRLHADGLVVTAGQNFGSWPGGFGQYMKLAGTDIWVWFGVNKDFWARHCDTPLWIHLQKKWLHEKLDEIRHRLEPLRQKDPPELFEVKDDLAVPIDLPEGVEYDAVLDAVVARLAEVARLIN